MQTIIFKYFVKEVNGVYMSNNQDIEVIDVNENGEVLPTSDERLLGMLIYATSFFTTIIGPIIIWLIKREESSFIDYHGKQYFNFVISYFIYSIIAGISIIILVGMILVPVVAVSAFVFTIIAAIKAYNGETYQIPFIIKFLN